MMKIAYCEKAPPKEVVESAGLVYSLGLKADWERHEKFHAQGGHLDDEHDFDSPEVLIPDMFGGKVWLWDDQASRCRLCSGWVREKDLPDRAADSIKCATNKAQRQVLLNVGPEEDRRTDRNKTPSDVEQVKVDHSQFTNTESSKSVALLQELKKTWDDLRPMFQEIYVKELLGEEE